MPVAHDLDSCERTADVVTEQNVTFEGLALSPKTLEGLKKCGFSRPSPIQLKAIPLGRCGFDLIVEAKSGTGKTAVFGIIALEMLIENGGFQVLILAPTREIASQVGNVLRAVGSAYDLNVEIVMGGTNLNDDIERLKSRKFQILVGSPGRVIHLIKKNTISLRSVRLMVLDEADKLMEESFQKDINYIYTQLPNGKQIIAASATYTSELRNFLQRYMQSPLHAQPNASSVLLGVVQHISTVATHENSTRQIDIKYEQLLKILSQIPFKQCLIFCKYQIRAETIRDRLRRDGWPADFIAGSQSQTDRLNSLKKLQNFSCRILVATDLVARGIDASNVNLIINVDPPDDCATYLHRIGRAGRYGSRGIAISILSTKEKPIFNEVLASLGNIKNTPIEILSPVSKREPENQSHNFSPSISNKIAENNEPYLCSLMISDKRSRPLEPFQEIVNNLNEWKLENSTENDLNNLEVLEKRINILDFVSISYPKIEMADPMVNGISIDEITLKMNDITVNSSDLIDVNGNNSKKNAHAKKNVSKKCASKSTRANGQGRIRQDSNLLYEAEYPSTYKIGDYNDECDMLSRKYNLWRTQLATISSQIQQAVYLRTLMGIDY